MDIIVYADWKGLDTSTRIGILSVTHTLGHAVFTFAYDKLWINAGKAQNLDPDLQLYDGPQQEPPIWIWPNLSYETEPPAMQT